MGGMHREIKIWEGCTERARYGRGAQRDQDMGGVYREIKIWEGCTERSRCGRGVQTDQDVGGVHRKIKIWEAEEGGRDHVIAATDIPRSRSTDTR